MFRVAIRQKEKKNPQCQAKVRKKRRKGKKKQLGNQNGYGMERINADCCW